MADFDHFFASDWGKVGGRASNWGEGNVPMPPPLMPPLPRTHRKPLSHLKFAMKLAPYKYAL